MQIAGIQKMTLVDFPGKVAATIFTRGCPFRCGFCHNPELVLPDKYSALLDEKQILDFLESRLGKLAGVCITGGEPCMQKDIDKFISYLKALGYDVKLDTNGYYPEKLEKIIKDGDVDYIAMDIKNSLDKYALTTGLDVISNDSEKSHVLTENIKRSIKLIMGSGIDYEFRTTVMHPYHEIEDFEKIGELIKGSPRYYLQNYRKTKQVNEELAFSPLEDDELKQAQKIMQKYIKEVGVR